MIFGTSVVFTFDTSNLICELAVWNRNMLKKRIVKYFILLRLINGSRVEEICLVCTYNSACRKKIQNEDLIHGYRHPFQDMVAIKYKISTHILVLAAEVVAERIFYVLVYLRSINRRPESSAYPIYSGFADL